MGNALSKVLKVLLVGVFFALLGHALAGCDGGGVADLPDAGAGADARSVDVQPRADAQGPGLGRTDAGMVFCEVPSPTLEWAYTPPMPGNGFVVLTGDVVSACEAWKVANPILSVPVDGHQVPRGSTVSTAGVDCRAVSEDFGGSTGLFWCVGASDEDSSCSARPDGSTTCEIWGLSLFRYLDEGNGRIPPKTIARTWAACSPDGAFVGWLCT